MVNIQSNRNDVKRSISEAVELIDFTLDGPVNCVAIKPNLCYYWDAYTGYTTDPRIVSGIIDLVRERYGLDVDIKIAEADATAMRTKYAFKMLGYEKLAREKKVELFNLSKDKVEEEEIKVNGREINFKIPKLLLNSDLFINVPKLKVMRETHITCAMKNVFGCIASPRKIVYHPLLSEAIVGINKILRPNLNIVDGLVALASSPVQLDLIMTSVDSFSVDVTASQIMGYNPSKIEFLRIASKENIGSFKNVSTCGEDLTLFKDKFPKTDPRFSKFSWKAQLWLLKSYHKITGDIVPPALEGM